MKCDSPRTEKLKQPTGSRSAKKYSVAVPCGKCFNCKRNRVNAWQFRLTQELKRSENAYFITLTYEDSYLTKENGNHFATLVKTDLQDFIKALRYQEKENKLTTSKQQFERAQKLISYDREKQFRYYACGEYGTKRRRPHYHIILFNIYSEQSIINAWSIFDHKTNEYKLKGNIDIDPDVNVNNIDYCLKYIEKDSRHAGWIWHNKLQKEFSLMSKGLGENYIQDKRNVRFHHSDIDKKYVTTERGYKIPMPRYYANKIYTKSESLKLNGVIVSKMETEENEAINKLSHLGLSYDQSIQQAAQAREHQRQNYSKRDLD